MKKILYLPIETIAREFDARILIAHQAISRNYAIIIGPRDKTIKAFEILKGGIYFYKSHGIKYFPKKENLNKKAYKFITLDEEGLIFVDDDEYLRNSKPNELDHLDIIFTWGSYQRKLLVKANPKLSNKIIPVGNTRFDLLRPEFKPIYSSASNEIRKKWGKYILINTRFAAGNYSRLYGCSYIESREHQFITIIGRSPSKTEKDFIIKEEKYDRKLFNCYVEMLKIISQKFSDINFILRPHPSEDIINWKEALNDLKNVHVIFKGTAIDWIYGAQAVIHTGCTTGIEAWALEKLVIVYNPKKEQGIEPPLPNKFGMKINNIEDLCIILKDKVNGKAVKCSEEQLKIARSYIKSITGDYSFTRFLDVIDKFFYKEQNESNNKNKSIYLKLYDMETIKDVLKINLLKFLSKNQAVIKKYAGQKINSFIYDRFKKYPGLFTQFKKFPILKKKDISNRLAVYDKIFFKKYSNNYLIQKVATDTYLIRKK